MEEIAREPQAKKPRMLNQDIAKGFCIIAVVLSHVAQLSQTGTVIVYALIGYLMSCFFIISGYNFHGMKHSYWKTIWIRFRQLVIPLLEITAVFAVLMGVYSYFVHGSSISDILWCTLFSAIGLLNPKDVGVELATRPFMIPSWFIWFMFFGYIIFYAIAEWVLKNKWRTIGTIFVLVSITTLLCYFGLDTSVPYLRSIICAPFVAAELLLGNFLGQHKLLNKRPGIEKFVIINSVIAFAIMFVLGLLYPQSGTFAGGRITSKLGFWEVPYTFFMGFLFTYWLLHFSRVLEKIPVVSKYLIFTGQNSEWIYLIHMPLLTIARDILQIPARDRTQPAKFVPMTLVAFLMVLVGLELGLWAYRVIKAKIKEKNDTKAA